MEKRRIYREKTLKFVLLITIVLWGILSVGPLCVGSEYSTFDDYEFARWALDNSYTYGTYCELKTSAAKPNDFDTMEILWNEEYDFCQKALIEIDQFYVSKEMQPIKNEFQLFLQYLKLAAHNWEKWYKSYDPDAQENPIMYFDQAKEHYNNFSNLYENWRTTKIATLTPVATPTLKPTPSPIYAPVPPEWIVAGGSIGVLFVTILIYFLHHKMSFLQHLSSLSYQNLRLALQNPQFTDYRKTRRYAELWPSSGNNANQIEMRKKFEVFARTCWSHAEDVYNIKLFKRFFRKRFAPIFERYKRLYGKWFDNNSSSFTSHGFVEFVQHCKWRKYLDPRTADRLRWDNEFEDYEEYMIHPFHKDVRNPLPDYLRNIPNKEKLVAADIGCGNGSFIVKHLASNFKKVYGIDYSDNMLEAARKKCSSFVVNGKVDLLNLDLLDLTELYNKIDIAFSINSILPRNPADTHRILREISKILKQDAKFIAIIPSFTGLQYIRELYKKKFRDEKSNRLTAWLRLRREFDHKYQYNRRKKLYADDQANVQRFIGDDEIKRLLEEVGLKVEILGKGKDGIVYPWELCKRTGYGYFPDEEKPWDCFVVARKK